MKILHAPSLLVAAALALPGTLTAAGTVVLGWNHLGMHCMDSDYSAMTVLPPYNILQAQLIVNGLLITNGTGYTVTYQAIADPSGSINTTSIGKDNFWTYTPFLYGALAPDHGLAGFSMPGTNNVPQTNVFEKVDQPVTNLFAPVNWWQALGIPILPYDDALQKNTYPMMRLIARNSSGVAIATNDVVLPVSDEMDCRLCHGSGTQAAAQPAAGWVWDGLPERDYRLNVLRLHDERQFAQHAAVYAAALAANNYNPAGLYRRVTADGKPVFCALCHASKVLQTPGFPGVPQLTTACHSFHTNVVDPILNMTLNAATNRAACYRCHPGSTTRCLRGVMGSAIAADGSMEMQCQSCHGNLSAVGATNRIGWLMQPDCQACHTGTATSNSGQIRYTSALTNGVLRVPADRTFATTTNTPSSPTNNFSLYSYSVGHGGLQCSACHGSTHAEFPTTEVNDNLRNIALQGHAGMMSECTVCHTNSPNTVTGGPHGLHPLGQTWVSGHQGAAGSACQACHGTDYRGTVLSQMQADRTLTANGTRVLFRGAIVSCYICHNGPGGSGTAPTAPTASNISTNTTNDKPVSFVLPVAGTGATPRIISLATNGAVGLNTNTHVATYFPNPGFVGTDRFTFAAYDTAQNSALATGTVTVAQGPFSITAVAHVPPTYPAGWTVAFGVVPTVTNNAAPVTFNWNFGDGSPASTNQFSPHAYATPSNYNWSVVSTVSTASVTNTGVIGIGSPVLLSTTRLTNQVTLTWPSTIADTLLLSSATLGPPTPAWVWVTNTPAAGPGVLQVTLPATSNEFFRILRPW